MNKNIKIEITENLSGKTVKEILFNEMNLSVATVRHLKNIPGSIKLNNEHVRVTKEVSCKDIIEINIDDENSVNIVPENITLDILYEDDDIIALNKPRNMPTHPSHNHHNDTLANGLMYYFKENFTFRAITRLDRDTSGVVLVAKNRFSAQILGNDIKNKKIRKKYIALINGTPEEETGIINAPIKRTKEGIILRCVGFDGKEAITEYKVLKKSNNFSLVELIPVTGKTHQLRVHMSYIGTPIYGDDLYGAPQNGENIRLHCEEISFKHPFEDKIITIKAKIPDDIKEFIDSNF